MATQHFTAARLNDTFAESSLDHPVEHWAPPLAPTRAPAAGDGVLREDARQDAHQDARYDSLRPITPEEHLFQAPEKGDLQESESGFRSRPKLIGVAAVGAALAVAALAYFFWPSAGEQPAAQTAQSAAAVDVAAVAPGQQTGPVTPEPSPPAPATAVAWPDLPPSATVEASSEVAAPAPIGSPGTRQAMPASQNQDIVFLQRPGVNIRSTPSANGIVLGTAPKGTRFNVKSREGDWVQVESARLKGWISSQFVASNKPR